MIREATPDDAKAVAPLIIQAMGELANKFSNTTDADETLALFDYLFKLKNNQYSYQHTLVYIENGIILGSLNAYDGGKLAELRKTFLDLVNHNSSTVFSPEAETEIGEFYLDTISVHPTAQGKGIGKQLIDAGINWAVALNLNKVGLLVEVANERALALYETKGFKIQNQKKFMGGSYNHMVYQIKG